MAVEHSQGMREAFLLDTTEDRPVHLVIGRNGTHIRLSSNAYELLQHFVAGGTVTTFADRIFEKTGQHFEVAEIERAYQHILARIAAIEERSNRSLSGFWLRKELLSTTVVNGFAQSWTWLYRPLFALPLAVILFLFWMGYGLLHWGNFSAAALFTHPSWYSWSGAYLLFLFSTFAHELGHAAACRYFQIVPGPIGFTFYLIYPAFYSDVSAAWRLKRGQRVCVDIGGAYFQSLIALGFAIIYWVTGVQAFGYALFLIAFSLLFSLNPVFKFDGYWIVSDALGVTNLAQQPWRIVRHAVAEWRGKLVAPLPWPASVLACLAVYTWLSICVWGYFVWQLLSAIINYLRL